MTAAHSKNAEARILKPLRIRIPLSYQPRDDVKYYYSAILYARVRRVVNAIRYSLGKLVVAVRVFGEVRWSLQARTRKRSRFRGSSIGRELCLVVSLGDQIRHREQSALVCRLREARHDRARLLGERLRAFAHTRNTVILLQ